MPSRRRRDRVFRTPLDRDLSRFLDPPIFSDVPSSFRRDDFSIPSLLPDLYDEDVPRAPLVEIEDRRRYHPVGRKSAPQSTSRIRAKVRPTRSSLMSAQPVWAFAAPKRVAICVRRKQRKEVLHALRRTGRKARFHKKARWSTSSNYRC